MNQNCKKRCNTCAFFLLANKDYWDMFRGHCTRFPHWEKIKEANSHYCGEHKDAANIRKTY